MKAIRRLSLALSALLLAGLSACGGNGGGGGVLAAQSNLIQALSYAPTSATSVAFTDWTLIKQYAGAQNITGQSDESTRIHFLASAGKNYAVSAFYGADMEFQQLESVWSWDTTDLLWEAELDGPGVPVYILRFRSDFDFTPVIAHFTENGFSTSAYQGATIYSHRLDISAAWMLEPSNSNAAVAPGAHIMIWSSGADSIRAALDAHANSNSSLAGDASFRGVAAQMGAPASAILAQATPICSALNDGHLAGQVSQAKASVGVGALHAYTAMGMSYQQTAGQPAELIDLHYGSGQDAQTDLNGRKTLATSGQSLANQQPYSQDIFTVTSASVSGSDLLLHVTPLNNQPQVLFDMFNQYDLLFAACS